MNPMLDAALQYAGRGWPVFRLSRSKVPLKGSHGFKDATTDVATITRWWQETPWANIGLATGQIVVFDADGPGGFAELSALAEPYGGLAAYPTLIARTARGAHFYFWSDEPILGGNAKKKAGEKGKDGLDIKAQDGLVVLPPSVGKGGFRYEWIFEAPILPLPDWARAYAASRRAPALPVQQAPSALPETLGVRPSYLPERIRNLAALNSTAMRDAELPDFLAALKEISAADCSYDEWFIWLCCIHDFDSGPTGRAIASAWCKSSPLHQTEKDEASFARKWDVELKKSKPGKVLRTKASIYDEARRLRALRLAATSDARSGEIVPPAELNGHKVDGLNGHAFHFGPVAAGGPIFIDLDDKGRPKATATNAAQAIEALGVSCRKDTFHEKMLVGGHLIDQWAGDLSDDVIQMLRRFIKREHRFDPGERNTRDAAVQLCLEHQFNPVTEYLDGLEWDRVRRIDTWCAEYMNAPDTPFVRAAGRLMLIAAVRRARVPGTKFDQVVVFEGPEGTGKSTAIRYLAGDENFSDQPILAGSDREQQEAFTGVWLHEVAELEGMRRTDVQRLKQFISRTEDRARPAYGRIRVDMKRRGIFIGTTNENTYLKSETGNRRFWPIATGSINTDGLKADRDQLWAEAAHAEDRGESIVLDVGLRLAAAEEQAARLDGDPWVDIVDTIVNGKNNMDHIGLSAVLSDPRLGLSGRDINQMQQTRVARILIKLGFERYQQRDGVKRAWRYRRVT